MKNTQIIDEEIDVNDKYRLESNHKKGKLRIYFGYAAGVGKTYAMLKDAKEAEKNGIDVVAGYIEPHTRPETMVHTQDLEMLPVMELEYKNIKIKEFDLDLALKRKPTLILVDELAHTNANICRHKKRYQDIQELIQAGINVYTTINVQHIESLNDIVESITGIHVKERIPDSVFDSADQVELIDIDPDELIERLLKGKIYREEQAKRALLNFFTKDNLVSLREIALRRMADKVNRVLATNDRQNYASEHILVCISASPSNAKVVRTASRMADAFHGMFTALFIETNETQYLKEHEKLMLRENIRLAEQLGAQISTIYGEDVPLQIAEYAKVSRVSKIVLGRTINSKKLFSRVNFIERLTELAPNIDIHIIPDEKKQKKSRYFNVEKHYEFSTIDTLKSLALLMISTLIGFLFYYLGFSVANIITIYILGIQINALITKGRKYSAISSVFGVLLFNYFFTEPRFSLEAYDPGYPVTFLIMLAASLITSSLTKRLKEQLYQSVQQSHRTEILLETSRKLQQAKSINEILEESANQIIKLLNRTVIVYLANDDNLLDPIIFSIEKNIDEKNKYIEAKEKAVAEWVYKNNKRAGATTNTLSSAKCLYLSIRGTIKPLAVVGVQMEGKDQLDAFEKNLLIAMLGECGLALEKEYISENQKEVHIKMQQEQLRANLLRTISHDLRTPLTTISGNAGILLGNSKVLNEEQKKVLYNDIYEDSVWLINLVENLLSITRIDKGSMNLNIESELIEEVIEEALNHVNRNKIDHKIEVIINDDEFLMAKMDSRLIVQVIINIVDNAIKYTHIGSNIKIFAKKENDLLIVEISDDGEGISDISKVKLFDMFYTNDNLHGDGRRGLGLGLSLCKSIVNAHGGEIYVKDNLPKGTIFGFTLKAEEVNFVE